MRHGLKAFALAFVLGGLLCVSLPAAVHAKANERTAAHRAAALAEARAAAAERAGPTCKERYVERQTRLYSARYGRAVGRWVGLARRVGWPKSQLPRLMKVIYRESKGDPKADKNPPYLGLLQFSPAWVKGRDWRTDPKESLRRCLNSVNAVGWRHWPTAY